MPARRIRSPVRQTLTEVFTFFKLEKSGRASAWRARRSVLQQRLC